ncbi:hypothetical protein GYMLUDRAFT_75472 [Collybiopsis luxurians FD-317 M1]|uniref:Uncharacterized protein n=1 Tax=Collybiopsis luxurians FD-317 M1 TaxID=944289 RepID=A0A0D0C534_9AGAR|nr:hypothetical protein GYMLUDRAFT_75472 [Collybiopsis luxurians FD-317 M1]
MLDAFKLKPFDLEPVYASWNDAPIFHGNDGTKNSKGPKDLPVDEWLAKIKEGCIERSVPREYWHKVAQHYMGEKAKARLGELKAVMAKVHGGNYRWNWEKFKIAMRNMGWTVDASETESIKVHSKPSGLWWLTRNTNSSKNSDSSEALCESPTEETSSHDFPPASDTSSTKSGPVAWLSRKPTFDHLLDWKDKSEKSDKVSSTSTVHSETTRRSPQRSATSSLTLQWPIRRGSKDDFKQEPSSPTRPNPQKSISDSAVMTTSTRSVTAPVLVPTSTHGGDANEETITTTAHAPVWLLNACNALDFLSNEHPKVMTTLSAVLITVGSIPSIPAISAGAGGALLASGAAQAVGAIAVGVGSWLKAAQDKNGAPGGNGQEHTI